LVVIEWLLTCDQKYVKGKPVKPYNSVIGEFFRVRSSAFVSNLDRFRKANANSVTGTSKIPLLLSSIPIALLLAVLRASPPPKAKAPPPAVIKSEFHF
jgi:hypothetical protein